MRQIFNKLIVSLPICLVLIFPATTLAFNFFGLFSDKPQLQQQVQPQQQTQFQQHSQPISSSFEQSPSGLKPSVLKLAYRAYNNAIKMGLKINKGIITIIDYSQLSSEKRLWVIDLYKHKVLFNTYVAHGKYSGEDQTVNFSNRSGSLESSIGLYLTKNTYFGHDGYSLVLEGLDKGFNDQAESRHIVMHGANYVNENMIKSHGRIGRSWGCPAVPINLAPSIIKTIENGSLIVAYYPNQNWLNKSVYLS